MVLNFRLIDRYRLAAALFWDLLVLTNLNTSLKTRVLADADHASTGGITQSKLCSGAPCYRVDI